MDLAASVAKNAVVVRISQPRTKGGRDWTNLERELSSEETEERAVVSTTIGGRDSGADACPYRPGAAAELMGDAYGARHFYPSE